MRVFFSVGEPSGDVHGANLIRALRERDPNLDAVGFGGDRMAAAGCDLHFPLCNNAIMGLSRVLVALPHFLSLLSEADRYFRHHRPDAVVLIDYPGFNWWIARRAKFHGIPVFYFVPPQIWGWMSWRVNKMRKFVDHVLCSLPFEKEWYRKHDVQAEYVGHPFFDECPRQRLDPEFMANERATGQTLIGILPGSRTMEVENNLAYQLQAAERIHREHPETRFLIASYKESQRIMADKMLKKHPALPARTFVGRTPEIIELSKACISVSGSVSLELLYRAKPTAIVYYLGPIMSGIVRSLVSVNAITLVNLLAEKMLYPEFAGSQIDPNAIANAVLHWLNDEAAYQSLCSELLALRDRVGAPGACDRAADRIVEAVARRSRRRLAA